MMAFKTTEAPSERFRAFGLPRPKNVNSDLSLLFQGRVQRVETREAFF